MRHGHVTGVQTCDLPISRLADLEGRGGVDQWEAAADRDLQGPGGDLLQQAAQSGAIRPHPYPASPEIGRASCRERTYGREDTTSRHEYSRARAPSAMHLQ